MYNKGCNICTNERCSVDNLVNSIINCNITSEAIRTSTPKTRPNRQSYANVLRNGLMANIVHGENLTKVTNNSKVITRQSYPSVLKHIDKYAYY